MRQRGNAQTGRGKQICRRSIASITMTERLPLHFITAALRCPYRRLAIKLPQFIRSCHLIPTSFSFFSFLSFFFSLNFHEIRLTLRWKPRLTTDRVERQDLDLERHLMITPFHVWHPGCVLASWYIPINHQSGKSDFNYEACLPLQSGHIKTALQL